MTKKSIRGKIHDEILRATEKDVIQLEKEKDPVKQTKLINKILEIEHKIILENIKKLSDSDFQDVMDEINDELTPTINEFSKKEESIAFKNAKDPKEFKKYKQTKKLQNQHEQSLLEIISDANLNRKSLERYLILILTTVGGETFQSRIRDLENLEFYQALNIVQNRFGFDKNWLIGMSLIQLYENLLKKKLSESGDRIHRNEKMPEITSRLIKTIKEKENRDVRLSIEKSTGLKKIRDVVSHEGYNQKITKQDLENIIKDIRSIEEILYPTKAEEKNN